MFDIASAFKTTVFLLFFLFPIADSLPQNINTPDNFPDPNFRTAVEVFMRVESGDEFTAENVALMTGPLICLGS